MSLFPSKHHAVVAGLMLSLTLGGVATAAPKVAVATQAEGSANANDSAGASASASGSDKSQIHKDDDGGLLASLFSLFSGRSTARLEPVSLSAEMKYFTRFESAQNYDQGFSAGDGYNAMGYYQFDRRWSLVPFMQQAYAYNPTKYAMFKSVLDRASELKGGAIYDSSTKQLTSIGQLASDAWHAAYKADPQEFSALQDSYAYNEYYLAVERTLKNSYGVDISDRADAVKGLAWGMCNLFGSGGVKSFFAWAVADSGMSDKMTDRELANALCDAVVDHIKEYAPNQSRYWKGWTNRYEKERAIVLGYVAEDEQQAADAEKPEVEVPGEGETESEAPEVEKPEAEAPEAGGSESAAPGAGGSGNAEGSETETPDTAGSGTTEQPEAAVPGSGTGGGSGTSAGTGTSGSDGGNAGVTGSGGSGSAGSSSSSGSANPDDPKTNGSQGGSAGSGFQDESRNEDEAGAGDEAQKNADAGSLAGSSSSASSSSGGSDGADSAGETDETSDSEGGKKSEIMTLSDAGASTGGAGDGSSDGGGGQDDGAAATDQNTAGDQNKAGGVSANAGAKSELPQTGDAVPLVLQAATGLALTGASVVALGSKRRKQGGE